MEFSCARWEMLRWKGGFFPQWAECECSELCPAFMHLLPVQLLQQSWRWPKLCQRILGAVLCLNTRTLNTEQVKQTASVSCAVIYPGGVVNSISKPCDFSERFLEVGEGFTGRAKHWFVPHFLSPLWVIITFFFFSPQNLSPMHLKNFL